MSSKAASGLYVGPFCDNCSHASMCMFRVGCFFRGACTILQGDGFVEFVRVGPCCERSQETCVAYSLFVFARVLAKGAASG